MRALFVDTGIWVALLDSADPRHPQARSLISEHHSYPFLTTDLVLSETITLLRREIGPEKTKAFGAEFLDGKFGGLVRSIDEDWRTGLALIGKYAEQKLSLADAVSVAVIRRMDVERVAAFDRHFRIIMTERVVVGAP